MKRLFLSMMAIAATATTLTLTSCGSDDNGGSTPPGNSSILAEDGKTLKGNLTGKQTLAAGDYVLGGIVTIENGGELTIPAGTTIKAKKGFSSYILVAQGGKLNANGTSAAPINFTSEEKTPKAGDWGGIIINGKAPISGANESGNTANSEVNNAYKYGGDNADDTSGSLTYVNILYAGARNTADIEHNGLTLNGVGNKTKIENIYILESADDAIEFFGGTVNVTNLLAVNPDDDMFDFTQGYTGTLKNCYGIWENGYTSTEEDPRGIEADGNLDGKGPQHKKQSNFTVDGMTIVNNTAGGNTTTGQKNAMDDVIKIRRGATATIKNALVKATLNTTTLKAKDLIDATDSKGGGTVTISLTCDASSFSYTKKDRVDYEDSGNASNNVKGQGKITLTEEAANTGADISALSWTGYTFPTR